MDSYETVVVNAPKLDRKDTYSMSLFLWLSCVRKDAIRHVRIYINAPSFSSAVLNLIATRRWTKLESMSLIRNTQSLKRDRDGCKIINRSLWSTVLRHCSSHLRELRLHYPGIHIKTRELMEILKICKHLTYFYYREERDNFDYAAEDNTLASIHTEKTFRQPQSALTHLIWLADYDIAYRIVLPLCPKLKVLTVGDRQYVTRQQLEILFSWIRRKRSPMLQSFSLADMECEESDILSDDTITGLRSLNISPFKQEKTYHEWLSQAAFDLFVAHQATVLALTIEIDYHDATLFWTSICNSISCAGPLTSLTYCFPTDQGSGVESEQLFLSLFARCPQLANLALMNIPWNSQQILRILSAAPALSKVIMDGMPDDAMAANDDSLRDSTSFTLPSLVHLELDLPVTDTFFLQLDSLQKLLCFKLWYHPHLFPITALKSFLAYKVPSLKLFEFFGRGLSSDEMENIMMAIPSVHKDLSRIRNDYMFIRSQAATTK